MHLGWPEGHAGINHRMPGINLSHSHCFQKICFASTDAVTFGTCRTRQLQAANGIEQQTENDEDLEKKMEEFLKAQAEKESGRLLCSDQRSHGMHNRNAPPAIIPILLCMLDPKNSCGDCGDLHLHL